MSQIPVAVGDTVQYARFTRRVVAVQEPIGNSQSVCIEVFADDNVWGGWISVPAEPSSGLSARVVARTGEQRSDG
jgi:hypothetical protein